MVKLFEKSISRPLNVWKYFSVPPPSIVQVAVVLKPTSVSPTPVPVISSILSNELTTGPGVVIVPAMPSLFPALLRVTVTAVVYGVRIILSTAVNAPPSIDVTVAPSLMVKSSVIFPPTRFSKLVKLNTLPVPLLSLKLPLLVVVIVQSLSVSVANNVSLLPLPFRFIVPPTVTVAPLKSRLAVLSAPRSILSVRLPPTVAVPISKLLAS